MKFDDKTYMFVTEPKLRTGKFAMVQANIKKKKRQTQSCYTVNMARQSITPPGAALLSNSAVTRRAPEYQMEACVLDKRIK